jgi:hypothetical protein
VKEAVEQVLTRFNTAAKKAKAKGDPDLEAKVAAQLATVHKIRDALAA